ncbi:MAG: molybdopterin molybdotransferase MoeA, partial [Cucumibacter sp.]
MNSVDEALEKILDRAAPLGAEAIPVTQAAGRVLAAPLIARFDNPPFDASAMDGYALRAEDGVAGAALRLIGVAQAGAPFGRAVGAGEAVRIFTGAPVPAGADAILMQEETLADGGKVTLKTGVAAGQSIRDKGRDFAAGSEVLPGGTLLAPLALTLAAACGGEVVAWRQPRLAILSTGDELVLPGETPGPSQIVGSAALGLAPLYASYALVTDLGIVRDDAGALKEALAGALDRADMVITIGGASVGDRDYVNPVLQGLGVEIGFWKVAMRPGKPLMFGTKGEKLVFGLPGNPVSA